MSGLALDKRWLLLYRIHTGEVDMGSKGTLTKRVAGGASLDIGLQDILDGVEDELLVIDSQYRVRFANSVALDRLQKKPQSPIGRLCYKVFHNRNSPCGIPLWDCPLSKVLQSGTTATVFHSMHTSGTDTYQKLTAYPLRDSGGEIIAIVELIKDITAEKELESQLLRRHHQLSALSNISSAVSGLRDLDAILRIALDSVLELIDSDIGGILLLDEETKTMRYRVQRGLSAKYAEETRISLGEGIAGKVAQTGESIVLEDISKDPRVPRPDLVRAEGLRGFVSIPLKAKDKVTGVMNVASYVPKRFGTDDVSLLSSIGDYLGTAIEQVRLYHRLARAGERYRTLLQHSLTAQEQERKRIARELHDETSQSITSLTLSLQAIIGMAEMKGIGDAEFMEKLRATHSYAFHAGNEIVKLMKELRPTLLDELGMPAAIHRYAKDTLQAKGINMSAEFVGTDQRFPPETEVTLFRIAQGAIGNILEHSEAKNASIKLDCNSETCVLQIEDDGKGFNVRKLTRVDPSGRGAGLFTMKERVGLIGGRCRVESRPGRGTRVTVKVPVAGGEPYEEDKGDDS
jgi:signal transduction histidine kinase